MTGTPNPENNSSRKGLIIQLILLGLLLVVTPFVSWRYLSEGLEYRKSNLEELSDLGVFPSIFWVSSDGDTMRTESLKDQLALVAVSSDTESALQLEEPLLRVRDQFQDRPDVRILHFKPVENSDSISSGGFPEQTIGLDSSCLSQVQLFSQSIQEYSQVSLPVLLVDRVNKVRRVFDVSRPEELQSLARIVAIMLPPKKVDKPVLKREEEK